MTRGRKPIPTELKKVRSTRKPPKDEVEQQPRPTLGIPQPPKHLDVVAKAEWKRVAGELFMAGILAFVDRAALAAYCQAWSRWEAAQRAVVEVAKQEPLYGGILMTSRGILKTNPAVTVMKQAEEQILRFAAEFGMTPAARARMKVHAPKVSGDEDENSDEAEDGKGEAEAAEPFDEFAQYH